MRSWEKKTDQLEGQAKLYSNKIEEKDKVIEKKNITIKELREILDSFKIKTHDFSLSKGRTHSIGAYDFVVALIKVDYDNIATIAVNGTEHKAQIGKIIDLSANGITGKLVISQVDDTFDTVNFTFVQNLNKTTNVQ